APSLRVTSCGSVGGKARGRASRGSGLCYHSRGHCRPGARETAMSALDLKAYIQDVPDVPEPGMVLKDITPWLAAPAALAHAIDRLAELAAPLDPAAVIAIESRGFIFGAMVAQRCGLPLHLVRKRGKLPRATVSVRYALEYGFDHLEMHADAIE